MQKERAMESLISNIGKLHTTTLGEERIRRNLSLDAQDVVEWCRGLICDPNTVIEKRGKNWYASLNGTEITVNSYSYTIITAHKH